MLSVQHAYAIHRRTQRFNLSFALWVLSLDNGRVADLRDCDKAVLRQVIYKGCRDERLPIKLNYLVSLTGLLRAEVAFRCINSERQGRDALLVGCEPISNQLLPLFSPDYLSGSHQTVQALRSDSLNLEELFALAEAAHYLFSVRLEYQNTQIPSKQLLDENPELLEMFRSAMRI